MTDKPDDLGLEESLLGGMKAGLEQIKNSLPEITSCLFCAWYLAKHDAAVRESIHVPLGNKAPSGEFIGLFVHSATGGNLPISERAVLAPFIRQVEKALAVLAGLTWEQAPTRESVVAKIGELGGVGAMAGRSKPGSP